MPLLSARRRLRSLTARVTAILTVAITVIIGLGAVPAAATWSIIGVDRETGEIGIAMASCVPAGVLGEPDRPLVPAVIVPGVGAAVTQGSIERDAPARIEQLIVDGAGPQLVIDRLLDGDEQPSVRQHGVVLLAETDGATIATHTGRDAEAISGDRTGPSMAVLGVLLVDDAALTASLEAFDQVDRGGGSLADSLVAALEAGSDRGGDRRCEPAQTALFAHLVVAAPGDDPDEPSQLITITVDEGDGQNPVAMLADAVARGDKGWLDVGLADPAGVSRTVVFAIGVLLSIAAVYLIRKGMGTPSARR